MESEQTVVVKGAGEVASGVAHYLFSKGLRIGMTEISKPTTERRTVAFAEAIFSDKTEVQGLEGKKAKNYSQIFDILEQNMIPVIVDPESELVERLKPEIVIDGRMAKENLGTSKEEVELVIGLGPGFEAGKDVDIVVETVNGSNCGEVIEKGKPKTNTGIPCSIQGLSSERVIRSPKDGVFKAQENILDPVENGEKIGEVNGEKVRAKISGTIRGLVKEGLKVQEGQKLGDIDPRNMEEFGISDRSLKIAKGVWKVIKNHQLKAN